MLLYAGNLFGSLKKEALFQFLKAQLYKQKHS